VITSNGKSFNDFQNYLEFVLGLIVCKNIEFKFTHFWS